MATLDEFADSTDWLSTPLSSLAPVESSLRCQVCKDFFQTPMMTSCSHTFCSLCIRRYLSQEGRCPACREPDQEMKLRRNWAVEETVAQFTQARATVLTFARHANETAQKDKRATADGPARKRRKLETHPGGSERRSTRIQSRNIAASQQTVDSAASQEEVPDSDDAGSVYQDEAPAQVEPHDGQVACPSCGRRMKENVINLHLDRCLAGDASSPPRSASGTPIPAALPGSIAYSQTKPSAQKDRLPTLNYSMFTEASLRKKLKEIGIANTGSKELMRKRHVEWMNLWNANCDAQKPKTKRELFRELDVWERTLGRQVDRSVPGVMVKDFDRDNWQKSNRSEFDDLIRQAKQRRLAKAATIQAESSSAAADHRSEDDASHMGRENRVDELGLNHRTDQAPETESERGRLSNSDNLATTQDEYLPNGSSALSITAASAHPTEPQTQARPDPSILNGSTTLRNAEAESPDMLQGPAIVSSQPKREAIEISSSPIRGAHETASTSLVKGRMFV